MDFDLPSKVKDFPLIFYPQKSFELPKKLGKKINVLLSFLKTDGLDDQNFAILIAFSFICGSQNKDDIQSLTLNFNL